MKAGKIFLWVTTIILSIIVVVLCVTPFIVYKNQQKLTQWAIEEVNKNFNGKLTVEESYVSPFKSFPDITIDLHHVKFYDTKEALGKPIYEIEDFYLGFDIMQVLKGNYTVRSIQIEGGHLDLVQYPNGDINLLLAKNIAESTKDSTQIEPNESFSFQLNELLIKDFDISKINGKDSSQVHIFLEDMSLSFRKEPEHMYTTVETDFLLDLIQGSDTSFFSNKHIHISAILDYNETEALLNIEKGYTSLEQAMFSVIGTVDFDDDFNINLKVKGDKPDFNLFIAFAPEEVAENLKLYKNEGRIYFDASIEGKALNGHKPAVNARFGCENAYFLNTQIDKRVDDLSFEGFFTNGANRSLETSEFHLTNFHAKPDQGIFRGNFIARNLMDPYIAMNLYSELDLDFVSDFLGFDDLEHLSGKIILSMDFDELIDINIPENNLARLKQGIDSELTVKNLSFNIPDYPLPVKNMNAHAEMRDGRIIMDNMAFKLGNSDFKFTGTLNDLPAIFHHHAKPILVDLQAASKKIVINELLSFDPELSAKTDEEITDFSIKLAFESSVDDLLSDNAIPKGEFFIQDFYAKLKNYPHTFHDFDADVVISDSTLILKNFSGEIDATDFHFSGMLHNYAMWLEDEKYGQTHLDFDFHSDQLLLNNLLSYEGENYLPEDYRDEHIRDLKFHGNLMLNYDSVFKAADLDIVGLEGSMKIHPLKIEDFKGRFHFEDEHILVQNFRGRLGKSDFTADLAYYTGEDQQLKIRDNYLKFNAAVLDFDELSNYETPAANEQAHHEDAFNVFEIPFTAMKMDVTIGKLHHHNILLENVQASLRMQEDHYIYLDTLGMQTAGGLLGIKGYFNGSNPEEIYLKSTITAEQLDLDKLLIKFDNFGQDYLINENLHGLLSGTINSTLHVHPDLTPILSDAEAHIEVEINHGSIVNFTPMQAVAEYFKDKNLNYVRFDTLKNTLDLKAGTLFIPSMNINSSIGFMEISGKQSLDMDMEYFVRIPLKMATQVGLRALLGRKNNEPVDPDQVDDIVYRDMDKRTRFLNLKISGNPDAFDIGLGKDKS